MARRPDGRSRAKRWLKAVAWTVIGIPLTLLALLAALMLTACAIRYERHQEQIRFAHLTGPARRLAIYDAFTRQIDRHYYDQDFRGFDWPGLKREWRAKAAAAKDDSRLYWDVLFQLTSRFPVSHVYATPPSLVTASTGVTGEISSRSCTGEASGATIEQVHWGKFNGLTLAEIRPGSAAARAGLMPGWAVLSGSLTLNRLEGRFLKLSGGQFEQLAVTGIVPLNLPPEPKTGKSAPLASPFVKQVDFSFPCEAANPSFSTRTLADGMRYIRFDAFEKDDLSKVADALYRAPAQGAILDLRSNPGGHVEGALNLLLAPSTPVFSYVSARGRNQVSADKRTRRFTGPLVVIVGPASASAAEILAAAVKETHRGLVVGRRTNGSVLGAFIYPLPDGGTVEVPVRDVQMLDGERLEAKGVAPDIEVSPSEADLLAGRDSAFERADLELRRQEKR